MRTHLKPYWQIGSEARTQEFRHPNQPEMEVMNIKPSNVANSQPAANLPSPKPAAGAGQGGDFSQMLKAAQSESPAPAARTQG